jgi:hypothetical protein
MKTLVLCFLVSAALFAQQQQQPTGPLTNQRIIDLVRAGINGDELRRIIATAPSVSFDLSPAGNQAMMSAGVTEDTIKAMAARENGVAAAAPVGNSAAAVGGNAPQRALQADVFVGYAYLNVDTNGVLGLPRQNLNGWETAIAVGNKWIEGEGDFGGYYKGNIAGSGLGAHDYSFLGGPRLRIGPVFFHGLVGGDQLTGPFGPFGVSNSQTGFSAALGGGVQSKAFGGHWAIRSSADYAISRHNIFGGPAVTQNNFRVSGGIVYVFGPFSP